jgi:hypothetical protein
MQILKDLGNFGYDETVTGEGGGMPDGLEGRPTGGHVVLARRRFKYKTIVAHRHYLSSDK